MHLTATGLPILILLACATPNPSANKPGSQATTACLASDQEWKSWLTLAIDDSPQARKKIETLGSAPYSMECAINLRYVLLEEWGHSPEERQLQQARLVWMPKAELPATNPKVKSPLVIVIGSVGSNGRFHDLHLKGSTGNRIVDRYCLDIAAAARFRPARQGKDYRESTSVITIHFYL